MLSNTNLSLNPFEEYDPKSDAVLAPLKTDILTFSDPEVSLNLKKTRSDNMKYCFHISMMFSIALCFFQSLGCFVVVIIRQFIYEKSNKKGMKFLYITIAVPLFWLTLWVIVYILYKYQKNKYDTEKNIEIIKVQCASYRIYKEEEASGENTWKNWLFCGL